MISQEINRISHDLATDGHTITSFDKLGINDFEKLAINLREAVESTPQYLTEYGNTPSGMIMCKDKVSKLAGSAVMKPVVDTLFLEGKTDELDWDMYTVNYYFESGHFFKPHQDYLDGGTVVIISALGTRRLDIYKKDEDDVFEEIETSYEVNQGEILLLDGAKDLGHSAVCLVAPSISVVGDVSMAIPTKLRN